MHWLYWLYFLLLLVTDVCGLILAAFTLPGLWLMLAGAAIYAWLTHGEFITWQTLVVLLVLAGGAEIAEIFVSGAGAKKAGASRWGMFGGLLGGIIGGIFLTGLIPIPILGTVIGICLGSFIGAFATELIVGKPLTQSAAIGYGAAKGRFTGILYKIGIGIAMCLIIIVKAPPFHFFKSATPVRITVPAKKPSLPSATRNIANADMKLKGTVPVISVTSMNKGTRTVIDPVFSSFRLNYSALFLGPPILGVVEKPESFTSSSDFRIGQQASLFSQIKQVLPHLTQNSLAITVRVPFNFYLGRA